MKKYFQVITAFLSICLILTSCAPIENGKQEKYSQEVQNLEKLCKIWGYVKYNHPAFLLGEKDWDKELLNLIPVVSEAKDDEVNDILHEWFASLGEIDYKTSTRVLEWAGTKEEDKIACADTDWISAEYLGEELSSDLQQFEPLPKINRRKAPVDFNLIGVPEFSNEKIYENIDYSDKNYRLLGLFRVWNVIEYYYPYLDIMDENWNDILTEFIPKIMEGSDLKSFELTVCEMTAHLHDAHVTLTDGGMSDYLLKKYGVPADLIRVDGKFVVEQVYGRICLLQPGDIILKQDEKPIEEIVADLIQYFSVPNEEKIANKLFPYLLRSDSQTISLTVLRDGKEEIVHVTGVENITYSDPQKASISHEILDGNIGLVNPSALKDGEIDIIMQEFKTTDGMIVDLRQYPSTPEFMYTLSAYLKKDYSPFVIVTIPSQAVPGTMRKQKIQSGMKMQGQQQVYYYEKPVVLLINENTQSNAEYTTMSLRTGENVTVLGSNSVGADGNVTYLPLLNGKNLTFTSLGVYTPEMGQTQRIGLSPDIEVYPTIQGIKEERDELMEAAIEYLRK